MRRGQDYVEEHKCNYNRFKVTYSLLVGFQNVKNKDLYNHFYRLFTKNYHLYLRDKIKRIKRKNRVKQFKEQNKLQMEANNRQIEDLDEEVKYIPIKI